MPVSREWWRPTRTLADWLTWLLAALSITQLLTPIVIDNSDRYEEGHRALVALFDGRVRAASRIWRNTNSGFNGWTLMVSVLGVATIALLIVWMWRSMHNALALGRTGARLAPGWAIASWFIPVASVVLPYLLFSDLWRSSDPAAERGDGWRALPGSAIVRSYWTAHVAGTALSLTAIGLALSGSISVSTTRSLLIGGAVLSAAATATSILVVRTITERQGVQQVIDPAPTERPVVHRSLVPPSGRGPGWYHDPSGHFDHRYWDGAEWTEHVATDGVASSAPVVPAGWYPDPTGRFDWRYWTGHEWTEHASRDQELFVDPL